jgi:hypothetical protein
MAQIGSDEAPAVDRGGMTRSHRATRPQVHSQSTAADAASDSLAAGTVWSRPVARAGDPGARDPGALVSAVAVLSWPDPFELVSESQAAVPSSAPRHELLSDNPFLRDASSRLLR